MNNEKEVIQFSPPCKVIHTGNMQYLHRPEKSACHRIGTQEMLVAIFNIIQQESLVRSNTNNAQKKTSNTTGM